MGRGGLNAENQNIIIRTISAVLYHWVDFTTGSSTDMKIEVSIEDPDSFENILVKTADSSSAVPTQVQLSSASLTDFERGMKIRTTLIDDDDPPFVHYALNVWEALLSVFFVPEDYVEVYAACDGAPYESWINGRAAGASPAETDDRGNEYTETHEDNDGSGNLIENFAGVIEDFLRDILLQGDSDIDMNSMNVASNDLPVASWKCSTQITKITKAKKYLADLTRSCKTWFWWQPDGYAKMSVIEDTYSASELTIDARDIENLKVSRTKLKDLKTAVDVWYDFNEAGGASYSKTTGISQDTVAQLFYNVTAAQTNLDFKTKHVHDSTTAASLQTFWLNWFKNLHNIIEGELPRMYLNIDIGTIVEFAHMPYKPYGEDITSNFTRAGQTIYKYFKIYKIDRGETLKFKAVQMHDLS